MPASRDDVGKLLLFMRVGGCLLEAAPLESYHSREDRRVSVRSSTVGKQSLSWIVDVAVITAPVMKSYLSREDSWLLLLRR